MGEHKRRTSAVLTPEPVQGEADGQTLAEYAAGTELGKRLAETDQVFDAFPRELPKSVYRWDVPGNSGYALLVEVRSALDSDDARAAALAVKIEMGFDAEKDQPITRALTLMESSYIRANEPWVVVDTTAVTMPHAHALHVNALLEKEVEAARAASAILKAAGCDIGNPQQWVDGIRASAQQSIAATDARFKAQFQGLSTHLAALQSSLSALINDTGFAPAVPDMPSPPDYSRLIVVAPYGVHKEDYTELAGAKWRALPPTGALTMQERTGMGLLKSFVADKLTFDAVGDADRAALEAAQARIEAVLE